MLGDRADHVEARRLRARRRGRRIGPPIVGDVEADALHALRGVEIARPLPRRDREMDLVVLGRDAHHFRAAPGDRTHIGVDEAVLGERQRLGRVDLGHAPGHLEIENARRFLQALGMLGRLEDRAAIGALAFENRAAVMQGVGEDMNLGVAPGRQLAVEPNPSVSIVECLARHGVLLGLRRGGFDFVRARIK